MNNATIRRRIYLGSELVGSVDRFPCSIEFEDDDDERPVSASDLGSAARLARTAQRGVLDYICVDDTLAGNPPFSGRRRRGLDAVRLATRLAGATEGINLIPAVRSSRVEPSSLLEALVGLEIASEGRHGWELELADHPSPMAHSAELLSAVVHDTWSNDEPRTRLAAAARAARRQRLAAVGSADGASGSARSGSGPPRSASGSLGAGASPRRRPIMVIRADDPQAAALAAGRADVARINAASLDDAAAKRADLQAAAAGAGRAPEAIKVLVDLTVTLADEPSHAEARKDLAEAIIGRRLGGDHVRYVGTPAGLAEHCVEWTGRGACDGFTFLPTSLPVDLIMVVDCVTPALAAASHFPAAYGRGARHSSAPRAVPAPRRRLAAPVGAAP
ncbi:MAG: LLM class flavin-dependent oxidoreductase [Bifidobacteriaceae bacterium]|nr:LLM class flavin-dependent oxidoreductase [Bifidobacteriaceae bacterium]